MNSPFQVPAPRRRLRPKQMADELNVSQRKLAEFRAMGCPVTCVGHVVWYEPVRVHCWLDRFSRAGRPGVKRLKGQKVAEAGVKKP